MVRKQTVLLQHEPIRPERALIVQAMFGIGMLAIGLSSSAGVLNVLYTPLAVLLAVWLMVSRPLGYIGFVFWLWMLTPFARRLADVATGYHAVSAIMIAPLAVTLLSAIPLVRRKRVLPVSVLLPHIVILLVLIYGFFIGAASAGLVAATFALFNWGAPVLFSLYLLSSAQSATHKAMAIFGAFAWGLAVIGLYGIYQFFYLPRWDEYWMRLSELGSIGAPVPMMVRVFSTLNGPAILAFFAGAGLLIVMTSGGVARKWPIVPGAVTFLLTLVRGAWGGVGLGVVALIARSDVKRKAVYVAAVLLAGLIISPIIANSVIGNTVQNRTRTIGNLSRDDSLAARLDIYSTFGDSPISALFGIGLGNTGDVSSRLGTAGQDAANNVIDSGILEIISDFGVVGIFMIVALLALIAGAWRSGQTGASATTAVAVLVASSSQFALANPFFGPAAMCFYPFVGLALLFGVEAGLFDRSAGRRVIRSQDMKAQ